MRTGLTRARSSPVLVCATIILTGGPRRERSAPALRGWLPLLPVLQPAFPYGLANTILFVFLPPFGQHAGVPRVGAFYLVYTGTDIAVRVGGGRLADRLGRRQVIFPALVGQTLGLVLCIGLQSTTVLVLVGLLNGTAQGFLFPATSAMAFELAPSGRRTGILAIFNMAVLLGGAVGATGFGWAAEALGDRPSFGLATALVGLGTTIFWRGSRAAGAPAGRSSAG